MTSRRPTALMNNSGLVFAVNAIILFVFVLAQNFCSGMEIAKFGAQWTWAGINSVYVFIYSGVLFTINLYETPLNEAIEFLLYFTCAACLFRTLLDYFWCWNFYMPNPSIFDSHGELIDSPDTEEIIKKGIDSGSLSNALEFHTAKLPVTVWLKENSRQGWRLFIVFLVFDLIGIAIAAKIVATSPLPAALTPF